MNKFNEWLSDNIKKVAVVLVIGNAWALKYDIEKGYWLFAGIALISTAYTCYYIGKSVAIREQRKQNEEFHRTLEEEMDKANKRIKAAIGAIEDEERKRFFPRQESEMDDQINDALNKK